MCFSDVIQLLLPRLLTLKRIFLFIGRTKVLYKNEVLTKSLLGMGKAQAAFSIVNMFYCISKFLCFEILSLLIIDFFVLPFVPEGYKMIPMLQEETRRVQLGRKGGAEHALGEKGEDSQSPPLAFPHCFYVFLQVPRRLRSLWMNAALVVLSTLHSDPSQECVSFSLPK